MLMKLMIIYEYVVKFDNVLTAEVNNTVYIDFFNNYNRLFKYILHNGTRWWKHANVYDNTTHRIP